MLLILNANSQSLKQISSRLPFKIPAVEYAVSSIHYYYIINRPIFALHSILSAVACLIVVCYRQQSIHPSTGLLASKTHVMLSSK